MTTLTSSDTFTVGAAATVIESASITILPVAGTGEGRGRLIHPTLGTYDYVRGPDEWVNVDGDAVISPIWSSSKTLLGSANTLFQGNLRDVTVEERWIQTVAGEIELARALLSFWMNPPDPEVDYVQWWPSYTTDLGFDVLLLNLQVGGKAITLSSLTKQGWVRGPIVLTMKIAGRV